MLPLLWALLAPPAQAGYPPEIDIPYQGSGTLSVGGHMFSLDGDKLFDAQGRVFVEQLYTAPVSNGAYMCVIDEGDGLGRLRCWDGQLQSYTLATSGRPNRLVLSGDRVAWTASLGGLPAVFVASANGKTAPRALTNVGVVYVPGQRPVGFVPPPLGDSLRFEGDYLRWDSPEGPQGVRWR